MIKGMKKSRLFVLSLLFLVGLICYELGKINSRLGAYSVYRPPIDDAIAEFLREPVKGRIDVALDYKYSSSLADTKPLWTPPEAPASDLPTGDMNGLKPFDEYEGYGDRPLFSQMFDEPKAPGWIVKEIDIDGDGKPEKAMINSLSMTSQPHLLRIVKDNKVVFEYSGSVVDIEEVYDRPSEIYPPGFLLTSQVWQLQNGFVARYITEKNGKIVPLWQQRHAGFEDKQTPVTSHNEAIEAVKKRIFLNDKESFEYLMNSKCVTRDLWDIDAAVIQMDLRQYHNKWKGCPGDPESSPLINMYKVEKATGRVKKYNFSFADFVDY